MQTFVDKGCETQLVGVAYSFQETEGIQANSWDVKLDAVVTELGTTLFT